MQSGEVQSGEVQSGAPISLVLAAIEPLRFATAAAGVSGATPPPPSPVGTLLRRLSRGLSFTSQQESAGGGDGGGGGGGGGAARPVTLSVERHPAARSVVARRMLRRLKADSA